jgi:NitT/TauT family transport system permease protein
LRIGATLAVVGVVVGELVGSNLGARLPARFQRRAGEHAHGVHLSIILLTLIGSLTYLLVVLVERRVRHYLAARIAAPMA